MTKPLSRFLMALAISVPPAAAVADSDRHLVGGQVQQTTPDDAERAIGFSRGSVIVAPIPFSNPLIGSGLAVGAGYLFTLDPGSDTSMVGVGGLRSENGSEALGVSASLAFDANRWTLGATFAQASLNYDLLAGPVSIPLHQTGSFARLSASYQVAPKLSFGVLAKYLDTDIASGSASFAGQPTNYKLLGGLSTVSLGIRAEYDSRDDDLYPTSGSKATLTFLQNQIRTGTVDDYAKATALFSHYRPVGDRGVLAVRLAACATANGAPFFDLCSLGGTDAMRGFSPTLFLGGRLASAQAEYRHMFTRRIGMVAFAGFGAVGPDFDQLDRSGAAGGLGLRIGLSRKLPVNFAIDLSHNDRDESLLYVTVGERF